MISKDSLKARNKPGQHGFTLLEILVVLTIMGFLIAMVAPRLAGMSTDASETVCDSNKNRAKTFVSAFYEKFNRYPNNLTNLVMTDGTDLAAANVGVTGYQIPYCSDDNPENGPEVLPFGHNQQYKFMIHRLDADEAAELKTLGITKVFNLNDYAKDSDGLDGATANGRHDAATASQGDRVSNWGNISAIGTKRPSMEPCEVAAGVGVAMCGCGIDLAGTGLTYVQVERGWAEEDIFGRIVFGLGPESELVSTGIVSNAAHCPGSIQNADNFTWGGYYLILPRLEATVARFADSGVTFTALWGGGNLNFSRLDDVNATAWAKSDTLPGTYILTTNDNHLRIKDDLDLHKAMESWDFDTNRQRDDEVWGLDIMNDNNVIDGGN